MNDGDQPRAGASAGGLGALRRWWSPFEALTFAEAARNLTIFAVAAASVALFFWSLALYPKLAGYLTENQLSMRARVRLMLLILASAAGGLGAAAWLFRRAGAEGGPLLRATANRCAPLMLLGLLPSFFCWRAWQGRELEFGLLATVYGLLAAHCLRLAFEASGREAGPVTLWFARWAGLRERDGRRWALGVVLACAVWYAAFFSYHTIGYHQSVRTLSWDLGIENNMVWNLLHGNDFMKTSPVAGPIDSSHFGYHATPFSYLILPFYALWPRPEALLLLQALLIAAAAIPLYLFAERRLGTWPACLIALAYLLYPAVHGPNLYDFHYPPMGVGFLWLTLYCVDSGRYRAAALAALLAMSIREDMAAGLAVLGGFIALTTPHVRAGLLLALVSVVYVILLKVFLMPRFLHGTEAFIWQWQALIPPGASGFGGVLMTLLANPLFALPTLFIPQKLLYAVQLGAPLAFLPWRRPIGFYLSIPGLLFTLLTVDAPPLIQISFQYTAHWVSFVFVAVVVSLEALGLPRYAGDTGGRARRSAWLGALVLSTLITSYQYGAVLQQNTAWGGFNPFKFQRTAEDHERYAALQRLIALVPADAKIAGSERVVPHVSSREDAYTLKVGLYDAEYILFEFDPRYTEGTNMSKLDRYEFPPVRHALETEFGVVAQAGPFVLARRGHTSEQNAEVLAKMK